MTSQAIAAGLSCLFDRGVYLGPLLLVSPIVAGLIINSNLELLRKLEGKGKNIQCNNNSGVYAILSKFLHGKSNQDIKPNNSYAAWKNTPHGLNFIKSDKYKFYL